MFARASFLTALVLSFPLQAAAQSSASLVERVGAAGETFPVPSGPLEISDTDYPLQSLLAAAEGVVSLILYTDPRGRVTNANVLESSGNARLDQTAMQIARTRWQFQPGTVSGRPSESVARVNVSWKLPAERVTTFDPAVPEPPEGTTPPRRTSDPLAGLNSPLGFAVRQRQQGIVSLKFFVGENGSIGDLQVAESSGFERLDIHAIEIVRNNWTFEAATLNGQPIAVWKTASIAVHIDPDVFDKEKMRCYQNPVSAEYDATISLGTVTAVVRAPVRNRPLPPPVRQFSEEYWVKRWTHVEKNGAIGDVLLQTARGLMRPNAALMAQFKQTSGYRRPPIDSGCWYYDPIHVAR